MAVAASHLVRRYVPDSVKLGLSITFSSLFWIVLLICCIILHRSRRARFAAQTAQTGNGTVPNGSSQNNNNALSTAEQGHVLPAADSTTTNTPPMVENHAHTPIPAPAPHGNATTTTSPKNPPQTDGTLESEHRRHGR